MSIVTRVCRAGLTVAAVLLLAGCWSGINPILEDYNSRFAVDTADALPPTQTLPPQQPQPPDWLRTRYGLCITYDFNIGSGSVVGAVKTEWTVKKQDGTVVDPLLYNLSKCGDNEDGSFHLYGPKCNLKVSDSPLTITSTVIMADGTRYTDEAWVLLFATGEEVKANWDKIYNP